MDLTAGQTAALKMIEALMGNANPSVGVLTGYAGTGKTTMMRVVAEHHGQPMVLAPTGKAALRVKEATGLDASTIHRWLYTPKENTDTGDLEFVRKELDEVVVGDAGLVIVDEASMLSQELFDDARTTCQALGAALLLVGDRFQLPPVTKGEEGDPIIERPAPFRAELTEVVRQALDNPILRASMLIRESDQGLSSLPDLCEMVPREKFEERAVQARAAGGVAIVHRNATRHAVNVAIRKLGGIAGELEEGEPLLVLHNNYVLDRFNGEVLNFGGWDVRPGVSIEVFDRFTEKKAEMAFGVGVVEGRQVVLSPQEIMATVTDMPFKLVAKRGMRAVKDEYGHMAKPEAHLNANLGYALTAHKSQGSEWDEVAVLVEGSVKPYSYMGRRWVYTAITRAKKKLAVCLE